MKHQIQGIHFYTSKSKTEVFCGSQKGPMSSKYFQINYILHGEKVK